MSAFIRLKNNGAEVNLAVDKIVGFIPTEAGGSRINLTNGGAVEVAETNRAVRSAIAKAGEAQTED
jgi:hypothetical protein